MNGPMLHTQLVALFMYVAVPSVVASQISEPASSPRIVAFQIRGNRVLNKAFIVAASDLRVGDIATPAALEATQRSLLATGNFGMRHVVSPQEGVKVCVIDVSPATNEGTVLIRVEENDVVKRFKITGNGPVSMKEIRAQLRTRPGFVLNINTLRADVDRIQKYYDNKRYIATVSEQGFGLANGVLEVPIDVGCVGPHPLTIGGLSGANERLAKRELGRVLSPGRYYNSHELAAALKRLEKHGIVMEEPGVCLFPPRLNDIRLSIVLKKSN